MTDIYTPFGVTLQPYPHDEYPIVAETDEPCWVQAHNGGHLTLELTRAVLEIVRSVSLLDHIELWDCFLHSVSPDQKHWRVAIPVAEGDHLWLIVQFTVGGTWSLYYSFLGLPQSTWPPIQEDHLIIRTVHIEPYDLLAKAAVLFTTSF